jgi:S-adenosylmethionine synthetase
MPMPIALAHRLSRRLATARKSGEIEWLLPDGKSQVSVEYQQGKPVRVDAIVVSTQHLDTVTNAEIEEAVTQDVIRAVVPHDMIDRNTDIYINPSGRFSMGGPQADAGLTGRKIIVDTYGGMARHGGGAFSGKDATKVDRSAAYAARYVAKNIVAAGLADRFEIQVSYAIGKAHPVSIMVETFGTGSVSDSKIEQIVREVFDLRPAAIIHNLELRRPIYRQTAAYGHFGRNDIDLPWERTDKIDELKSAAGALLAVS